METHLQQTAGPDEATRDLARRLADLAKNEGRPRFAEVVRRADAAQAGGVGRDEAYRAALEATGC